MAEIEVSAREELYEIAELLREADEEEKGAAERKDSYRGPFFDLISEVVREEIPLARQVVSVDVGKDFNIDAWKAQNYPEWRICGIDQKVPETMIITLEENETLKKFEFTFNGFKFGRQIRYEGKGFDSEAFYAEVIDPAMEESTWAFEPNVWDALADCVERQEVITYKVDEAKAAKVMTDYPETVAVFQEYMRPGIPKAALLPIRVAKEEEE